MKGTEKVKAAFAGAKKRLGAKAVASAAVASAALASSGVVAFASTPAPSLPSFEITTDMLTPLVDSVISAVGVVLPLGLGMFGLFLVIRLVPALFSSFARMR